MTRPNESVRIAAARSLFDYCACVLSGECTWAPGLAGGLAVRAHTRDQDDLHHSSVTHPGGIVWSAVVTVGLERNVTWGDAVNAAALGYEVVVQVAQTLDPRQWHATSVAGVVGAAAAAARLMDDRDGLLPDAVGHATSVASGSAQAQVERTRTLLVHRAFAAETGVLCARAAAAGLDGNRFGLGGGRGAFGGVPELVLGANGSSALEETSFRLYPINGFAHAAIEAAASLAPVHASEIQRVRVRVAPGFAVAMASNPSPVTDDDAWWSIEHGVAIALVDGQVAPGLRPDLASVYERISLEPGDGGWSASVELIMRGGESRVASVTEPLGHPRRPATDDDLLAKWARLTKSDGTEILELLCEASPETLFAAVLPTLRSRTDGRQTVK